MTSLIYSFQESKHGTPDGGEDRLVVTDDFVAVIDGATSKSGKTFDGKTGGIRAAEAVADAVRCLPRAVDAFTAVARLSAAVKENVIGRYAPRLNAPDYIGDRPNASVVMYSADKREVWRVGEGHFKIGARTHFGERKIDTIHSTLRAAYIRALLEQGVATVRTLREKDMGREIIMPSLMAQSIFMNNRRAALGFGAIDGRPVPAKFVEISPVKSARRVMLSSDGVLGHLCSSRDPSFNMRNELESQLDYYPIDPLMIDLHKSTKGLAQGQKWHDDITVVEFSVRR